MALYIQPSEKLENAELVEPDLCLQQESLDADSATATSKLGWNELCDQVGVWLWCSYHSVKSAPGISRHVLFSPMQFFVEFLL